MLRDFPYVIGMILFIGLFSVMGTVLYITNTQEDEAVTMLNTLARNSAIQHVDNVSRVDIGHVYLNQEGTAYIVDDPDSTNADFETSVLSTLDNTLPVTSEVRFDYVTRAGSRTIPVSVYVLGEDGWQVKTDNLKSYWRELGARESVEAIRVQVRNSESTANLDTDDLDNADYWTYQSTIEVNRSEFVKEKMQAAEAE